MDGLPEWYRTRDRNADGQLGLYEWPRDDIRAFGRMDLNGDGFLEQREVMRFLGIAVPNLSFGANGTRTPDGRPGTAGEAATMKAMPAGAPSFTTSPSRGVSIQSTLDTMPEKKPKGATKSPDEFLAREVSKLRGKMEKDGPRFNRIAELQKLEEKYQKEFGELMPDALFAELERALDATGSP